MFRDFFAKIADPATAEKIFEWAVSSGFRIILVLVVFYVAFRVVNRVIDRFESRIAARNTGFESALESGRRIRTITSLLKHVVFAVLFGVGVMIVLRELGVDIAPIIAGAGILGLAVSFGAQNLVRDIISGFFMIIENQVRVGDVAVINGKGGTVEEMNFRTIVIRDIEGTVHVFPNGAVTELSNKSKGWARYVVDVNVSYKEDVDRVTDALRRVGEELAKDPRFGTFMTGPFEILGVDSFGANGYVIKCMIKTLPLKQWDIGRELRKRIKNKFEIEGIDLSSPPVNVSVTQLPAGLKPGTDVSAGDGEADGSPGS